MELDNFKDNEGWTSQAAKEVYRHQIILKNFRDAINVFGCEFFNTRMISNEEFYKTRLQKITNEGACTSGGVNFFEEFSRSPSSTLKNLTICIIDRKNTETLFKKFLVFIFDHLVDVTIIPEEEKEKIMSEIIQSMLSN